MKLSPTHWRERIDSKSHKGLYKAIGWHKSVERIDQPPISQRTRRRGISSGALSSPEPR